MKRNNYIINSTGIVINTKELAAECEKEKRRNGLIIYELLDCTTCELYKCKVHEEIDIYEEDSS